MQFSVTNISKFPKSRTTSSPVKATTCTAKSRCPSTSWCSAARSASRRLREQGLYPLNKRGDCGSLYVEIGVDILKDHSREEKELYQKLAELRHDKETAQEESFLEKMKNLFNRD